MGRYAEDEHARYCIMSARLSEQEVQEFDSVVMAHGLPRSRVIRNLMKMVKHPLISQAVLR